ncbi:hypothetical protein [Streptomyces zhihengii]
MAPRTSKALTAWTDLNDRQQRTLAIVYALDQGREAGRRQAAARGDYDSTPASEWRHLDFAHDPSLPKVVGTTEMQGRLAVEGWHNQGNGSTMSALERRGLITMGAYGTTFGMMRTVALTREGRAAARAGLSLRPTGKQPAAGLGRRSWEVLALLWSYGLEDKILTWTYSVTIEKVLIDKHVPPLAEVVDGYRGYRITDRGRDFYREHHAAHVVAHPDVRAPHPDGADAEPWPAKADSMLTRQRNLYHALTKTWSNAVKARDAATTEADAEPAKLPGPLPQRIADHAAARHQLWQDTARQRAELAAIHADELHDLAERAARAYAAATLAAFRAAVTNTNPLEQLDDPDTELADDGWDEPRLTPPPETGIHVIDAEAKRLYAAAVGKPLRRRGPAPKPSRRLARHRAEMAAKPGANHAALAAYLHDHVHGGALTRRLHPGRGESSA